MAKRKHKTPILVRESALAASQALQTFRRSTPAPSKGTFKLAVLIPNTRSLGNPKGCPNSCVE